MAAALTFEVSLPYRSLSSNGNKGSWRVKHRATSEYRSEAMLLAGQAMARVRWSRPERASVVLEFGIKGGRAAGRYQPRDEQNALASAKALIDGMVDAGVVADDSRKHLSIGGVDISDKWGPAVRVTVVALE